MYFKLECSVKKLSVPTKPDSVTFTYESLSEVRVTLRNLTKEEDAIGHKHALCTTITKRDVPDDIYNAFISLSNQKLPLGSNKDKSKHSLFYIDQQNNIEGRYIVPLNILPNSFQDFVNELYKDLFSYMTRTVRIFRWRCGASGPHNPIAITKEEWSLDEQTWYRKPSTLKTTIERIHDISINDQIFKDVSQLVCSEND